MLLSKKLLTTICVLFLSVYALYIGSQSYIRIKSLDLIHHYYVVQTLSEFEIYPDSSVKNFSEHGVSTKLPIYHGIIGAHFLAALFYKIGFSLPQAVQIVWDLSFVISFFLLIWIIQFHGAEANLSNWRLQWFREGLLVLFSALVIYELYRVSIFLGFFSQAVGIPFVLAAIVSWLKHRYRWSYFFFLFALFTYPDFALFVFPVLFFLEKRFWLRILLAFAWSILFYVFIRRMPLPGAADYDLSATLLIFVLLGGFLIKEYVSRAFVILLSLAFSIEVLVLGLIAFLNSNFPNYYLVKHQAWAWVLFVLLLSRVVRVTSIFFIIYVCGIMYVSGFFLGGNVNDYSTLIHGESDPSKILTASSWQSLEKIRHELALQNIRTRNVAYISDNYSFGPWLYILAYFRAYEFLSLKAKSDFLNHEVLKEQSIMELRKYSGRLPWYNDIQQLDCKQFKNFIYKYKNDLFLIKKSDVQNCVPFDNDIFVIDSMEYVALYSRTESN